MNRKQRTKAWNQLKKVNRFERIDEFGNLLDWNKFAVQWGIHKGRAMHLKMIGRQDGQVKYASE